MQARTVVSFVVGALATMTLAGSAFFANPQACLCTSPLVKTYGWGLHHDAQSRVAAYAVDSPEYRAFAKRKDLQIVRGMRNSRKAKSGA